MVEKKHQQHALQMDLKLTCAKSKLANELCQRNYLVTKLQARIFHFLDVETQLTTTTLFED